MGHKAIHDLLQSHEKQSIFLTTAEGCTSTYEDFLKCVASLRSYFEFHGVRRLAIYANKGLWAYSCEWACYLSGVVFCPLNPKDPISRVRYCLNAFEPDRVFSDSEIIDGYLEITIWPSSFQEFDPLEAHFDVDEE